MKNTIKLFRFIALLAIIGFLMTACDDGNSPDSGTTTPQTVAKPTAIPAGGNYSATQTVTLVSATAGVDIYYTRNGSTPTTASTKYTSPITITSSTTLKVIAIKAGMTNSDILTEIYTITIPGQVAQPTATPAGGTYPTTQTVTLTTTTAGADIHYTTDGNTPTASSAKYIAPITISTTTTLKAIAVKTGMTNSVILTVTYTIGYIVSFDADGGTPAPASPVTMNPGSVINQPSAMTKPWHTFGGWYTDSALTVPAAFPIVVTANVNLYAGWIINTFTNIADVTGYLNSLPSNTADDPTSLTLSFDLGIMTLATSGWQQLLNALNTTGKYVNLNLSACTMNGTSFNPDSSVATGKDRIVSIVLPTVATSIEEGRPTDPTFRNFNNLKSINGAYITTIGSSAFYSSSGNTILQNAEFPRVTSIDSYAFYRCSGLQSANYPQVTTIGLGAFERCTSLQSVSFPQATSIGDSAFDGCTDLQSASFPASADVGRYISTYSNPFAGCTSLTSFTLSGSGNLSVIDNGKALVRNGTALLAYPSASGYIYITSSNTITSIDSSAFYGCTNLTNVSIDTAKSIGNMAFYRCTSLEYVSFLQTESIGRSAFYNCTSLRTVNMSYLKSIGDSAFEGCTSLPSTMSFYDVTSVGNSAFEGCTSLTKVQFYEPTTIGSMAFWGCTSLQTLIIPKVISIGNNAFSYTGTTPLSITMVDGAAPTLGYKIFNYINSAKTVTILLWYGYATGFSPASSPFVGPSVTVSGTNTTASWANGLRGGSWNGTTWADTSNGGPSNINQNISVIIEQMPY